MITCMTVTLDANETYVNTVHKKMLSWKAKVYQYTDQKKHENYLPTHIFVPSMLSAGMCGGISRAPAHHRGSIRLGSWERGGQALFVCHFLKIFFKCIWCDGASGVLLGEVCACV